MQREITRELVRRLLPGRMAESNKGSYGSVLAAAGSMAYRGAAALCTEGALRGGAGLVYLASVEPVIQLVLSRTPECCACGCRTAANGGIHPQDADALRRWFADRHTVLLAGPGLGESAADVCKALLGRTAPWAGAVLDADALNALAAGKYRGGSARKHDPDAPPRRGRAAAGPDCARGAGGPRGCRRIAGRKISLRRRFERASHTGCRAGRHGLAQ